MILKSVGINSLVQIITYLLFIGLTFRAIQALRFDRFIRKNHSGEAQVLLWLIAISIGYLCGSFFLTLFEQIQNVIYLIK